MQKGFSPSKVPMTANFKAPFFDHVNPNAPKKGALKVPMTANFKAPFFGAFGLT